MDHTQPQPAAPVLYTPDGTAYYAAPPTAAPLVSYQPTATLPATAVQYLPAAAPAAYLPSPADGAGRDPWPARLLAGGIGLGAGGLGLGFLLQTLAAAATGLGLLAAVLALAWLLKSGNSGTGGGRGGAVNVSVNVTNRNR